MPRFPIRPRSSLAALALVLAAVLAGCGGNDPVAPQPDPDPVPDPLPPGTPQNDTPANTLIRFERAYENQALAPYVALLAADFRFEFSAQSDPMLVSQYGTSWSVSDDSASTAHLFDGFTNDLGEHVPGAASIQLTLAGVQLITHPDDADSAAYYRYAIVPALQADFDVPPTDGYLITSPFEFQLVRGDAAVLRAGQPDDSTRWYVRRQFDKSPSLASRTPGPLAPTRVLPAEGTTWGAIKANYR